MSPTTLVADDLEILDDVRDRLGDPDEVPAAIAALVGRLAALRRESNPDDWARIRRGCLAHPLAARLHEDPFTGRAFRKPRGYAGDAVMMDHIYDWTRRGPSIPGVSPMGRAVYEVSGASPSARAVRARRDLLADWIDEVADEFRSPTILSLACGHLREAQLSRAIERGRVGRFLALDQDAESLEVVRRDLSSLGVEAVPASVLDLLRGRVDLPELDAAYTAGLYDYLAQPLARKVTAALFDRLRPGGQLLIANFLPDIRDVGYMEAIMDWDLIYRDAEAMVDLASRIPAGRLERAETFVEENENMIFLSIRRRG